MPCWSQQTSTVSFSANTDLKLLAKALEGLGFVVRLDVASKALLFSNASTGQSGTFQDGSLTIKSAKKEDMNVFKRAYSTEVVRSAAQRFGWQVKQPSANTFQVTRRA